MILCIGLTPTVQRTLRFDRFEVGAVNRAKETAVTASGKAVNVARVLHTLGAGSYLLHPLGGGSGAFVEQALLAEGVAQEVVPAGEEATTRTCTTLLVDGCGPTTELVEEARALSGEVVAALDAAWRRALPKARFVCLSGSLAPGVGEDFYAHILAEARDQRGGGVRVLVDGQKGPLKAALAERPFLVKPNREEAAATLGFPLTGDALTDARTAVRALLDAGAQWALVSMGRAGSLLGGRESPALWHVAPPAVETVNPIGSGDSLAAGTVYALLEQGAPVPEAVAYGTACAAANALTLTSGVVNPADVARLLPDVWVTEM